MKGLLLAGGRGTRLRPLTFSGNKHMIPIANKPMLLYALEGLRSAGITDIGIVLGPIIEGVRETIGDGSRLGIKATYIYQGEPKGLAHAVLVSEDFLKDEPFVMYLGDNLLKQGAKPLKDVFEQERCDCVIAVSRTNEPQNYGVVEMSDGKIVRLVEKPKEPKSNLALVGVYLFTKSVFEAVKKIKPSWRNELEITDAIQTLLDSGGKIHVQFVDSWWKDTGKPEDLLEANRLVLTDLNAKFEGNREEGVIIAGSVSTGKGTTLRRGCVLKGPITIGSDCDIGPNTRIGPHTSIGDNVKVEGGEVENSIVMDGCVITCGRRIVDSIVGKGSKIASNSTGSSRGLRLILGESTTISV